MKETKVTIDLRDYSPELLRDLAEETEDPEILSKLMYDAYTKVRIAVAENDYTTTEMLRRLAIYEIDLFNSYLECDDVLIAIIKNHNCTEDILSEIIDNNTYWEVEEAVAESLKASPEILEILSDNAEDNVRFAVANNPNASDEVLKKLKNDIRRRIGKAAKYQLKIRKNKVS